MPQCDAVSKTTQRRCKRQAVPGNTKCPYHGGASLAGPLSPRYKDGRYSKYAPPHLRERYLDALADPELMSLRDNIALTTARISQILADFDNLQPSQFWIDLQKEWATFMYAVRTKDAKEQARSVAALDDLIRSAMTYVNLWRDLDAAMELQRKQVDSEQRRLTATNQLVTVEEAMVMLTSLVSLIKETVFDVADVATARAIIAQVSLHYQKLLAVPDPHPELSEEEVDGEYTSTG